MSTTLTNGLKLPDKGSVDWYANMQNNYTILDGAVGTIAEHTSALAGKAPLVHTHTKSDITDFPAYGSTAGTICEGNDSRLSDARTPVAHTHTKSDVTDLFNSANTWSGDNTYSASINYKSSYTLGNLPASAIAQSAFKILDSTGTDFICDINSFQNALATGLRFTTRNKMDANGFSPSGTIKANYLHFLQNAENKGYLQWDGYTKNNVIPLTTNTYDLGTSSYQWNNLYAKNYYYNGVAWGLDKANVWSGANTFRQNITYERTNFFHQAANPCYFLKDTELEKGSLASTVHSAYTGNWQDKNGVNLGYVRFVEYATGKQTAEIRVSNLIKNGALDPTGSTVNCTVNLELQPSGEKSLIPEQNNDINLGTSDKKWKSLNGINPGALSLPKGGNTENTDWFDISSYITNVAGSASANSYAAPSDGWIVILGKDEATSSIFIWNRANSGICASAYGNGTQGAGRLAAILPVRKGMNMGIICKFSSASDLYLARFYPCEGNV